MKLTKNQKLYYSIGGIAILGVGYYFWNKNRKSLAGTMSTGGSASTGGGGGGGFSIGTGIVGAPPILSDTDSTQDVVDNQKPTRPNLKNLPKFTEVESGTSEFPQTPIDMSRPTMPAKTIPTATTPEPTNVSTPQRFSASGRRDRGVSAVEEAQELLLLN